MGRKGKKKERQGQRAQTPKPLAQGIDDAPNSFWNRRVGRTRFTYRAVAMFLVACLMLDVVLYFVFEFGLGQCYGILCLL